MKFFGTVIFCVCFFLLGTNAIAESTASKRDQVVLMLSSRHLVVTGEQLEKAAGGKDALVKRLLGLRLDDEAPFIGVRAGRYLLDYADLPEVKAALEEDVGREDRAGLARVYAIYVDRVVEQEFRRRLAGLLIDRGVKNTSFRVYSKVLLESKDGEVAKLARENLM